MADAIGCRPGIIYGLPKVHKANFHINFQLRPIYTAYPKPPLKLAKSLVPLLTPISLTIPSPNLPFLYFSSDLPEICTQYVKLN